MAAETPNLQALWKQGAQGHLSPLEQMRVWALRDAFRHAGVKAWGMNALIAGKVQKIGGGSPEPEVVRRLLSKIDEDSDWYPGKVYGEKCGRKRALSGLATNIRRKIISSIMISSSFSVSSH